MPNTRNQMKRQGNRMKITKEFIEKGAKNGKVITSTQFKLLGTGYPPMKGWKNAIIGKEISDIKAEQYLSLKGVDSRKASKKVAAQNRYNRIQNLDLTSYSKPIADELKDKIKNKPINLNGLIILDSFLEYIQKNGNLTELQLSLSKKIEELYKDKRSVAVDDAYVYLMYARKDEKDRLVCKIGFSKNPNSRLRELKIAIPKIELLAFRHGSMETELKLHDKFASLHQQGEWFAFRTTKEEAIRQFNEAVDECNYEDNPTYRYRKKLMEKWKIA